MKTLAAALLISLLSTHAVAAQPDQDKAIYAHPATEARLTDGQVKKIDKVAGKVMLVHGPLDNPGMPAMTMAFKVLHTEWLDRMKVGDRIRFLADSIGGVITVVRVEPAN